MQNKAVSIALLRYILSEPSEKNTSCERKNCFVTNETFCKKQKKNKPACFHLAHFAFAICAFSRWWKHNNWYLSFWCGVVLFGDSLSYLKRQWLHEELHHEDPQNTLHNVFLNYLKNKIWNSYEFNVFLDVMNLMIIIFITQEHYMRYFYPTNSNTAFYNAGAD